jgi:outer membrane protein assembly factor BamA
LILGACFCLSILAQTSSGQSKPDSPETDSKWSKNAAQRDSVMERAEREQFTIRWIYISGNTYTRFREFRKRMLPEFEEGSIFARSLVEKSVERISKMNSIYPITMDKVEVMVDEQYKYIDFTINVRQRPKSK